MALPRIGVLALQGAVDLHVHALERLGVETVEVRRTEDLARVDGLVLPGGESSTISKLLVINQLFEPLAERLNEGMPAFGTCAGNRPQCDRTSRVAGARSLHPGPSG